MTTLTIEVPDDLMAELVCQDRPVQEVVVDALERALAHEPANASQGPSKEEIVRRLTEAGFIRDPSEWDTLGAKQWRDLPDAEKEQHLREVAEAYFPDAPASRAVIRGRMRLDAELTRAEMADRLIRLGIVRNPEEWDTAFARRWRNLPDDEKRRFIEETRAMFFPDAPASSYIIENRR